MQNLTKKIQRINEPFIRQTKSFITTAKILEAFEKNNICTIEYIDNLGKLSNRKGIEVKFYAPQMPNYFPQVGEIVLLECYEQTLFIVGPYRPDALASSSVAATYNTLHFEGYGIQEGQII